MIKEKQSLQDNTRKDITNLKKDNLKKSKEHNILKILQSKLWFMENLRKIKKLRKVNLIWNKKRIVEIIKNNWSSILDTPATLLLKMESTVQVTFQIEINKEGWPLNRFQL